MPGKTNIRWTGRTWNALTGCSRVEEECRHCYAERLTGYRLAHLPKYAGLAVIRGDGKPHFTGEIRVTEKDYAAPFKWPDSDLIFVNSMSDLFHENTPIEAIDMHFAIMMICDWHVFQILTKRGQRMAAYINDPATPGRVHAAAEVAWRLYGGGVPTARQPRGKPYPIEKVRWPIPNVWYGVSAGSKKTAIKQIPHMLQIPAPLITYISCEPFIAPIELDPAWFSPDIDCNGQRLDWRICITCRGNGYRDRLALAPIDRSENSSDSVAIEREICPSCIGYKGFRNRIKWIISGGESGYTPAEARPMHPAWPQMIDAARGKLGFAHFYKQPGNWRQLPDSQIHDIADIGKDWSGFHGDRILAIEAGGEIITDRDKIVGLATYGFTAGHLSNLHPPTGSFSEKKDWVIMHYTTSKEGDITIPRIGEIREEYPEAL